MRRAHDLINTITAKHLDDRAVSILMTESAQRKAKTPSFLGLIKDALTSYSRFSSQASSPIEQNQRKGEIDFSDFEAAKGTGDREMWDNTFQLFSALEEKRQGPSPGHGPRVRADKRVDISNYLNMQYTGPVFVGSQTEQMVVIYDTGSDWLAFDTDYCSNCIQPVYNASQSTTYVNVSTDTIN